jgi:adenylate kinase family enzyme
VTRVIVLGCAGSGKSTFAGRLSERIGAPLIDLDALWRAQGDEDLDRFRETMVRLHAGESWISDGNFSVATFDIRLPRAHLVVWLDRPRLVCAWRAVFRVIAPGEPHHRLRDLGQVLAFIRYFDRKNRPLIEAERIKHGPDIPVVHLATDRATDAFLANAG